MRWQTLGSAIHDLQEIGPYAQFSPAVQRYLAMLGEGCNWKHLPAHVVQEAMVARLSPAVARWGFIGDSTALNRRPPW